MSSSHEFVPLKALITDGTKTIIASQDLHDSCYKCHQLPRSNRRTKLYLLLKFKVTHEENYVTNHRD